MRSTRHVFVLYIPLLAFAAACGRNQTRTPQPPTQNTPAATEGRPSAVPAPQRAPSDTAGDSLVINVDRPTVVAYFAVSQAEMDSEPGGEEVLSDFQFYLPLARDSLAKLGVAFHAQTGDTVLYREGGVVKRWSRQRDSAEVGYVFFAPGSAPRAKYGVDSHLGVQEWVKGLLKPSPDHG